VRLIDFGSAQWETTSVSYKTTKHYVAPEVADGHSVHNRMSDAYSVGKTLLAFIKCDGGEGKDKQQRAVKEISGWASLLCHASVKKRMSLSNAEAKLERLIEGRHKRRNKQEKKNMTALLVSRPQLCS
jgi:serine/threonine protein kinase